MAWRWWTLSKIPLTKPPDSDGPDWREVWLANDDEYLYVRIRSENAFDAGEHFLAYIDADDDVGTGLRDPSNGIVGSDLLIFGNEVYRQITNFNDGYLGSFECSARWNVMEVEMAIPRSFIEGVKEGAKAVTIRFHNDAVNDFAPDGTALKYVFESEGD